MLSISSDKPLAYDVFCGAGGATKGYQDAGFYVVGVDIKPQKNYCGDEFIQMDALVFLERLLAGYYPEPFFIHTSPPCQGYSPLNRLHKREYPDLIGIVRALLMATGKPYIIENVPDAPLINPILLCGTMFGLLVIRHRAFEVSPVIWWPPAPCRHWGKSTPKGQHSTFANGDFITVTGGNFLADEGRRAMGIDWMTRAELSQAIPPAYTEWLGRQLLAALDTKRIARIESL